MALMDGANILALTESHLSEEIMDCEIKINGFDLHRADRTWTSHGGVIIYTKSELKAIKLCEWKNAQCEFIAVLVKDIKCLILCLY